jgi:hypothetical protein
MRFCKVAINLGCLYVQISEQFLHRIDGNSVLNQPTCKSVSETVKVKPVILESALVDIVFEFVR